MLAQGSSLWSRAVRRHDQPMKDTLKNSNRVYERPWMRRTIACIAVAATCSLPMASAVAQNGAGNIIEAREAWRKGDRARLAALRASAVGERQALAPWVDYWDLSSRIGTVQADEVDAFYQRWPGTYVEDRLRNDWLLELGRRRDWAALSADYPRFKMNDDRQVICYALLADHLGGKDVREAARTAWFAQKDADDGCALLATTLFEAKQLGASDAWRRARVAVDGNKPALPAWRCSSWHRRSPPRCPTWWTTPCATSPRRSLRPTAPRRSW